MALLRNVVYALALLALGVLLGACGSLLPHGEKKVVSRWSSFDEAIEAYRKIIPYETRVAELKDLGFSPNDQPNVRILDHAEVLDRLLTGPDRRRGILPRGLRDCVSAGDQCSAYAVNLRVTEDKRYGNFLVDMLNFKRKVETKGWEFNTIIVLIDEQVVYKTWSGTPEIHEYSDVTNPLGPLQGIGPSMVPRPEL